MLHIGPFKIFVFKCHVINSAWYNENAFFKLECMEREDNINILKS